ncbi:MAG: universal stress protein UspA [Desulfurococcales archaeon ex4484_58]|nr:MAG: universal stress protein UspA [Desulfurococcales archaeon ex4484_58]
MGYREAPTYEISFMFRKILVPVDGSENSLKALELALDLAKHYGSSVHAVFVKPRNVDLGFDPISKAKKRIKEKGVDVDFKTLEYDPSNSSVASTILNEIVEGNYDLVVMGARGRTLSSEIDIGSKALAIASNSPVTVIIVR